VIRRCGTSFGFHHRPLGTDHCLSTGPAMSLTGTETVQQRLLLSWEAETTLPDCAVVHHVSIDHWSWWCMESYSAPKLLRKCCHCRCLSKPSRHCLSWTTICIICTNFTSKEDFILQLWINYECFARAQLETSFGTGKQTWVVKGSENNLDQQLVYQVTV